MKLRGYRCDNCGGEYVTAWSDAAAHAEAEANFGRRGDAPGMARVCDDCYREIMRRVSRDEPPAETPKQGKS